MDLLVFSVHLTAHHDIQQLQYSLSKRNILVTRPHPLPGLIGIILKDHR